jgi:hypothetical protein
MAFYGVQLGKLDNQLFVTSILFILDVMVRELNLKFKLAIQQKGGVGIRSLRRIFNQMDFNGNKKLDISEFEQALAAFGIFPKKVEL